MKESIGKCSAPCNEILKLEKQNKELIKKIIYLVSPNLKETSKDDNKKYLLDCIDLLQQIKGKPIEEILKEYEL